MLGGGAFDAFHPAWTTAERLEDAELKAFIAKFRRSASSTCGSLPVRDDPAPFDAFVSSVVDGVEGFGLEFDAAFDRPCALEAGTLREDVVRGMASVAVFPLEVEGPVDGPSSRTAASF